MDSINVVNLKIEKANAIKRFNRLRKIATFFRIIEIVFVFVIISKLSVQFPVKFNISGEYFWKIYSALFGPRFVFVIGNVIVITLFLKSGWNSNSGSNPNQNSTDFYTEYLEKKQGNSNSGSYSDPNSTQNLFSINLDRNSVENRAKQGISSTKLNPNRLSADIYTESIENRVKQGYPNPGFIQNPNQSRSSVDLYAECVENREKQGIGERKMSRSKSEDMRREVPRRQLRRSETDMSRRSTAAAEEEMSGEEFRRRVEGFIARQQRNLREEEFSAVVISY